jgi:hypothetical protein
MRTVTKKVYFYLNKNPDDKTDYPTDDIINDHIKQSPLLFEVIAALHMRQVRHLTQVRHLSHVRHLSQARHLRQVRHLSQVRQLSQVRHLSKVRHIRQLAFT